MIGSICCRNILLVGLLSIAACTAGDKPTAQESGKPALTVAFDSDGRELGSVQFPTTCDAAAKPHLVSGLALLHHMTYIKAKEAFLQAADADPECAIAYWGAAMTHVHPLWPDSISREHLVSGQALLDKAANAAHGNEREQAYVAALQAYYSGDPTRTERERLGDFLIGWETAHQQNLDDPEASLFYALALIATASPGDKSYSNRKKAGAIAAKVREDIPQHPGAHHYIIHAYDVPPLAEDALETARSYDDVAPENSHALHMTSHIFTRRGLWPESIVFNVRAADASRERTPSGEVSLHHLHALDYLAYAYLQQAEDDLAKSVLDGVTALEPPYQNHAATVYTLAAVPVRYAVERQDWEAAATIEAHVPEAVAWDQYPHLVAIPVFARALGATHTGDYAAAREAIETLQQLEAEASSLNIAYDWGIQVAIQRTAASAWLAFAQGSRQEALELMQKAAEMEASTEKNPVTPSEVLPARELFGDMLVETGDYARAQKAYEAALQRSPNRFRSLYGAGRAAELAGDAETATRFYQQLLENCPNPNDARPQLRHARAFVS